MPRDLYASVGKQRSTQYKMNAQWAPLGSHCSSFFDSLGHLEFGRAFSVSGGVLRNGFQNPGAEKKNKKWILRVRVSYLKVSYLSGGLYTIIYIYIYIY